MDILITQNNFNVDIPDYNKMSNKCILGFFWTKGKCSVSENTTWTNRKKILEGEEKPITYFSQTLNISSGRLKYNCQIKRTITTE